MQHYTTLVNREHPLDACYVPEDLAVCRFPFCAEVGEEKRMLCRAAAEAAGRLIEYGKSFGHLLFGISGYRSYQRQKEIYETRMKESPAAVVELYVARPGASEHQTGLALDVSAPSVGLELEEIFGETPEGKWLAVYAPMFGFIIRYPKGKEEITGYAYEPWHIRYVGKSLYLYLALTGLTLEEYHRI